MSKKTKSSAKSKKKTGKQPAKKSKTKEFFNKINIEAENFYSERGKVIEALAKSNFGLKNVIKIIEKTIKKTNDQRELEAFSTLSLTKLIEHIVGTHHTFVRNQLPKITQLFKEALQAENESCRENLRAAQKLFLNLKLEAEAHLAKEEDVLFPYVREMEACVDNQKTPPQMHCGTAQLPIRQMEHEHEVTTNSLNRLREITNGYAAPENSSASLQTLFKELEGLEIDFHKHIYLENELLFPKTLDMEQKAFNNEPPQKD